jgi:hypothetical protein
MKYSNFLICIDNSDYPASLEKRKIYEVVPDTSAEEIQYIRVIDESSEDHLYPSSLFIEVISLIPQLWTVGAAHSRDKPPDKLQADLTIKDNPGNHLVSRAWPAPTILL